MSQSLALLYAGWVGNLTSLGGLQSLAGLTNVDAAKLCGVARETYRRWRTDRTPPLYAFRLLTIRAGYVPWPGWEKWFYNPFDQTLNHVDLKNGFYPGKVAEFLFLRQDSRPEKTTSYQTRVTFKKSMFEIRYMNKPIPPAPAGPWDLVSEEIPDTKKSHTRTRLRVTPLWLVRPSSPRLRKDLGAYQENTTGQSIAELPRRSPAPASKTPVPSNFKHQRR